MCGTWEWYIQKMSCSTSTANIIIATVRKIESWITINFITKEAKPKITLFKSLLSKLEYCCVLTAPFKAGKIEELKNVQRTFTAHINLLNQATKLLKSLELECIPGGVYLEGVQGLVHNQASRWIRVWSTVSSSCCSSSSRNSNFTFVFLLI